MSETRHVLMVGGPADGRWMVAVDRTIVVAEMSELDWTAEPSADVQRVVYSVQSCELFGVRLDMAIAESEFRFKAEQDKAVIRALFQRDVAEAMGAYR